MNDLIEKLNGYTEKIEAQTKKRGRLQGRLEAGLEEDNIEVACICTKCRNDLFFSYRAEKITGRFATLVMLR